MQVMERRRSSLAFKKRTSLTLLQKQAAKLENVVQAATTNVHVLSDKRKATALFCSGVILVAAAAFFLMYNFHGGFRRTVQFWKGMGILGLKYKWATFQATTVNGCDDAQIQQRLDRFHEEAAPVVTQLMLQLGGIYLKVGQVLSTVGDIVLPRAYVQAFQSLQDGLPARDFEQVKSIIETSTGRAMDDIFESFDETPIGVASIGQAHIATLRKQRPAVNYNGENNQNNDDHDHYMGAGPPESEQVIVKIQHPEVAEMLQADLNNAELFVKLFVGSDNDELMRSLRTRHENELDFNIEAENLREATRNMQAAGLEPSAVRIPRVRNETGLCTKDVLVMEYLPGTSLAESIRHEQDVAARALGHKDGAELRSVLSEQMRENFKQGGGENNNNGNNSGGVARLLGNGGGPLVKVASRLFRFYANTRERVRNLSAKPKGHQERRVPATTNINLSRVLKTMAYVHGVQILQNGVFNADPHPGNVLVLPDGRLGLLDYGMLGRISNDDRITLAKTVVALSKGNKAETASCYRDYKATWKEEETITDVNILHRMATIHFDAFDLSPITLEDGETTVGIKEFFDSFQERRKPSWIEEASRLSGLLIGVSAQAARPISLAKQWAPVAKQALLLDQKQQKLN